MNTDISHTVFKTFSNISECPCFSLNLPGGEKKIVYHASKQVLDFSFLHLFTPLCREVRGQSQLWASVVLKLVGIQCRPQGHFGKNFLQSLPLLRSVTLLNVPSCCPKVTSGIFLLKKYSNIVLSRFAYLYFRVSVS